VANERNEKEEKEQEDGQEEHQRVCEQGRTGGSVENEGEGECKKKDEKWKNRGKMKKKTGTEEP